MGKNASISSIRAPGWIQGYKPTCAGFYLKLNGVKRQFYEDSALAHSPEGNSGKFGVYEGGFYNLRTKPYGSGE
jgi:hypothetical protein